jgi:hypothetical protein
MVTPLPIKKFLLRKASIVVLFVLIFGGWANAQTECPALFHSLSGLKLDERFALLKKKFGAWKNDLSKERRAEYNYEVYRMLQEAFYPLLRKFNQRINTLSDKEILSAYQSLVKESKISRDKYAFYDTGKIHYPDLQTVSPDWFSLDISEVHRFNTSSFARRNEEASHQLEKTENFVWANLRSDQPQNLGLVTAIQEHLITPVGEYGPEFSEKLVRTSQIMRGVLAKDQTLRKESAELIKEGRLLLEKETARMASHQQEKISAELAPVSSALEGVLSLHQLFASVLTKKVPGAETGTDALRELIFNGENKSGLVSELTTRHPMGVVGPMALSGSHFPGGLIRTPGGKLTLSPPMIKALQDLAANTKHKSRCPMAGLWRNSDEKTGLQELAEAYWKVYSVVDQQFAQGLIK